MTETLNDDALFEVLLEAAPEPPSDYVPGTAAPPAVIERLAASALDAELPAAPDVDFRDLPEQTEPSSLQASFFEAQAREQSSAQAAARLLLVASELWSLEGNAERALACARSAAAAAPSQTLAHQQVRALLPIDPGTDPLPEEWLDCLQLESRLGSDGFARAHASLLLADALRLRGDDDSARALEENARRAAPTDQRPVVAEIVTRLLHGDSPHTVSLPEHSPLRGAALRVAELWGGREAAEAAPGHVLERARRHLAQGRTERAAEALMTAAELGLAPSPLLEIAASLGAVSRAGRPLAVRALRRRLAEGSSRALLRTLALRALELRDAQALEDALDAADPASGTFDLAERVVLSILGGGNVSLQELDLETLARQCDPAFALALAPHPGAFGEDTAATLAAVGAHLGPEDAHELFLALESLEPTSPLRQVLSAELALCARDGDEVVRALGELASHLPFPDLHEAVGLLHEAAGRLDRAADAYAKAHELGPKLRLVRALSNVSASAPVAQLLEELARREPEAAEAALLWLEASLAGNPGEAASRLEEAARDERLSRVVPLVGAFWAARSGDEASHRRWLDRALEGSRSATARGLLLLRKAHATSDAPFDRGEELESLARQRPEDVALRSELERLTKAPPEARASARLEASAAAPEDERWLLGEGLLLAWQAGALELASQAARRLLRLAPSPVSEAFAHVLAEDGGDATELSRVLLEAAGSSDPSLRAEALERLAALDENRGDRAGALEWRRSLLAAPPAPLRSLANLERDLLASGSIEQITPVAGALGTQLPPSDARPYKLWLGAGQLLAGDLRAARRTLEPLTEPSYPPTLALCAVETHAQQVHDDEALLRIGEIRARAAEGAGDACATALACALAAFRLRRRAEALAWVDRALAVRPEDLSARLLRAELLEGARLPALAAEAWEAFAGLARVKAHALAAWLRAGELWLEGGDTPAARAHAEATYRAALRLDTGHTVAFQELRRLLTERGETAELVELLQARREHATSPEERVDLERALAQGFHSLKKHAEERKSLETWLALDPNAGAAWRAHAQVCTLLEDFEQAKVSWLRFLETRPDTAARGRARLALATLYDEHLGDATAAARTYEEVLAERPGDLDVMARLVRCYATLGSAERAIELQTKLIQLASTPQEKRDGALLLAQLYERLARDTKRAAATLERTRKAWPLDPAPLAALAHFLERQGEGHASRLLVERTGKDVWRKLESERVEASLLDMLGTVAELLGQSELSRCARHAHRAWLGEEEDLEGAGAAALKEDLDELLAPPEMSSALRTLLRRTGRAFDVAFPIDPASLGATRVTPEPGAGDGWDVVHRELERLCRTSGLGDVELYVTPSLGARCLPGRGALGPGLPQQVLIGPKFPLLPERQRQFLLLRALKLQQSGGGALARSRPEDAWPMLAALLHLFAPNWTPAQVDREKFLLARGQLEKGLRAAGYDDDVPFLVLEAIGTLTAKTTQLGEATRLLPNRAALLGTGSLATAFSAFAHLSDRPLADAGPQRWRWLNGHAECRDLVLFCASPAHAQARARLGLSVEQPGAPSHVQALPPRPPQRSLPAIPPGQASLPPRPPPRRGS